MSCATIAHDRRVCVVHPELEQPFRQPRAVAVADAACQHLGAGHDDPRARREAAVARARPAIFVARAGVAHVQVGRCPGVSGLRPALVIE